MAVEHARDRIDVGDDPGDVRRGGEAAHLQRAIRVAAQLRLEAGDVDAPVGVLGDGHDVGARLAPRQLVGVVLVGADEDDGAGVEVEQADELVDRARRARAAEDDDVVLAAVDRPVDGAAGVLPQRRGLAPGRRRLRVRVGVQRQDAVADEVLDERQRAAGGGGVRVHEAARAERPVEHRAVADHRVADPLDQGRLGAGPITWLEHCASSGAVGGENGRDEPPAVPARFAWAHAQAGVRGHWPWTLRARAWRVRRRAVSWATDRMSGGARFATWRHRRFYAH